jgi:hypothetical protein
MKRWLRHVGGGLFNALAEPRPARMAPHVTPRVRASAHGALGAIAFTPTRQGRRRRAARCGLIVANHVSYLDPT